MLHFRSCTDLIEMWIRKLISYCMVVNYTVFLLMHAKLQTSTIHFHIQIKISVCLQFVSELVTKLKCIWKKYLNDWLFSIPGLITPNLPIMKSLVLSFHLYLVFISTVDVFNSLIVGECCRTQRINYCKIFCSYRYQRQLLCKWRNQQQDCI